MSLADRWHHAILRNSLDLMRYEAGVRTEILSMLDGLGRDLVKELAGAGLDTPRTDWQRARMRDLLNATQTQVGDAYGTIADHHAASMADIIDTNTGSLVLALNEAAGAELIQGIKWTGNQLKALVDGSLVEGAPSRDWWARQGADLQNAFTDQMRQGMVRGEGVGELSRRVKDLMGTSTRNAEALVRTSALAANNAAQLATYKENADVIGRLQWTSTLDPRTCTRCGAQDGQAWAIGEPHAVPPLHWSCRCVCVPITKSWAELAKKNKALAAEMDKMEPGVRSSMGGYVSGDTTWESWLKGLPVADQQEILGPARQKLWEAGKLTITDLVDQRGNALTLGQLAGK